MSTEVLGETIPLGSRHGAEWVDERLSAMSVRQKVGQLLCLYLRSDDMGAWNAGLSAFGLEPGGVMLMPRSADAARRHTAELQASARVPLLIGANLESGTGSFILGDEPFANPMQVAATSDPAHARRLGVHCARAAHDLGVNWAFAPVIDVAINPHNPITNVRAFSDNPELVSTMGEEYVRTVEALGVATSPKHFPGDGVDDRDQHLVTTNNDLPLEEWERTTAPVWRRVIASGARTIMVGHIRQPALTRSLIPGIQARDILPATLSPELITGVLRKRLGFTGLVVSDNTAMAGMTTALPRAQALPRAIEAGCDMLLGSLDIEEDFTILLDAVADGTLSAARLDEAVRSVLRTKASLGLHERPIDRSDVLPDRVEEAGWREDLARASVTLVKDTQRLLPLERGSRRVLVHAIGDVPTFYDPTAGLAERFIEGLKARGSTVTLRHVPSSGMTPQSSRSLKDDYDLVVYFVSLRTRANSNTIRIEWSDPQGPEAPRHSREELPSLLVSIASPYVLEDMPAVGTAVNGYTPSNSTVDACLAALFGEAAFVGSSPVDPFAGRWDAQL